MDDSAEYRHVKRRRYITVALSVALTTVLCVGYVVADIFDKLPGVLTLQEVERITARRRATPFLRQRWSKGLTLRRPWMKLQRRR